MQNDFIYVECNECGATLPIDKMNQKLMDMPNFHLYCDNCNTILKLDKE